eukprot:6571575-Pyramimonas_sp.AAC.1
MEHLLLVAQHSHQVGRQHSTARKPFAATSHTATVPPNHLPTGRRATTYTGLYRRRDTAYTPPSPAAVEEGEALRTGAAEGTERLFREAAAAVAHHSAVMESAEARHKTELQAARE